MVTNAASAWSGVSLPEGLTVVSLGETWKSSVAMKVSFDAVARTTKNSTKAATRFHAVGLVAIAITHLIQVNALGRILLRWKVQLKSLIAIKEKGLSPIQDLLRETFLPRGLNHY
jgi:hypothetical protein